MGSMSDSNMLATITPNPDGTAWVDSHAGQGAVIGTEWQAVPEPGTAVLLGSELIGGVDMLRRKLQKQSAIGDGHRPPHTTIHGQ